MTRSKFKKVYQRRQNFKDWCDYWFTMGKYIRREDWETKRSSIEKIREPKTGELEQLYGKAGKYMFPDLEFVGECVDGSLFFIKHSIVMSGKWIMDDPITSLVTIEPA
jgi:hypothetical protein